MLYSVLKKKITSQNAHYPYVVEKIPADVAMEVVDLLNEIPAENPYETLKNAFIRRSSESEERKLHDLFNNLNVGHLKPSQLLRKGKSLLGVNIMSETMLKKLWMDKPHAHTTQTLVSLPNGLNLERLAEIVDKIHDNKQDETVFTTVQTPKVVPMDSSDELAQIKKSLVNLTMQVKIMTNSTQQFQRSRIEHNRSSYSSHGNKNR